MSARAEPVTAEAPRPIARPLLTQSWLDVSLLHWAVAPASVARLLPPGTVPDTFDGSTYVGLVPFRMHRTALLGTPAIPYLGSFPETNVRLYSVDDKGRRGVVFLAMDAARLLPALVGRASLGLPYAWSSMRLDRDGDTVTYTCRRRRPGPRGADSRIRVRIGEPVEEPSPLEHFLTARWGLHTVRFGRTLYLPNSHPRWRLRRAELLECHGDPLAAAGIRTPIAAPVSVLFSAGVPARFGRPL
ncbi:YqjF family protein [Stackebrandtia nassauensis]|uniref:DUF2071 domain-containing protein n=1 Tax=Stackebrandtia nassauensis (strain DSM 44728 / CIP 108903 / NRRL B-16338 / NBRC 102104 / LLR-40K-21) TaxID=446470 RepID=D3PUS4_STANL|nr:DUF2071 domain-containing protein [Stackebrandtia nassauensis]ADD44948.1 conserved hypothetical protein [Stackebrandtia nassauensis DSM 44728]